MANDVVAQYEMLTGENIELFLDKDAISWGEDWRGKIDESLATIAFFIPVLTPRYFKSPECRQELQFFARRAKNLGIEELVLPLHYVDTPLMHEDTPSDDLATLIKTFQWEDWRELRFAGLESEECRRGVARLAQRLVEANRTVEEADVAATALELQPSVEADADDSPGLLDQLVATEETLPQWHETLEAIGQEIELIGRVMQEATADIEKGETQGKGFAARLAIARRTAQRLREPAERVWSFGNEFASQLHQIDAGLRAIIERAPGEVRENPESRFQYCIFIVFIRELSAAREGLGAIQGMVEAISPIEGMSRDLRDPIRRLRQGLTLMVEAREVTDEWVRLIEDTGINCDDVSTDFMEQHPEGRKREVRDLD